MNQIKQEFEESRIDLMKSIFELLKKHDFNKNLINEAEKNCGFAKNYNFILFPNGLSSIISYFESWRDGLMFQELGELPSNFRISQMVRKALIVRIKTIPKEVHLRILSYYLLNVPLGLEVAQNTCNGIWRYLNDDSDDYNYYTKRATLMAVYLSSTLFFIKDESEGSIETDLFIDEALKAIVDLAKLKSKFAFQEIIGNIPILRLFS